MIRAIVAGAALCLSAAASGQGLTEDRVLLLWNSENAASSAVRDAYVAARPGVMEFDLDDAALGSAGVTRSQYNSQVRDPLLAFLSAGDHVLKVAAQAMAEATREVDTLVRAGGDEFVVVLPGLVDHERLADLARRLIQRLEAPIPFGAHVCRISGSAGIAVSHAEAGAPPDGVLAQADRALYASKNRGRGRVTVFSPDLPPLSAA